ncbi:glycosyltransferase [Pseudonocardia sp.]|uniref:glycosyltransferase n=1 Tax=Pseudonocardia sp. TaxID=60912 RepID=UPI0026351080|nr:glycosyltransferase [Pseudonocardia sp.]
MKVALVHDYLTQRGGAERVALQFCRAYPGAPLYTSLYDAAGTYPDFAEVDVRCGPLQRLAPARRDPRLALPLLAPAWDRTVVSDDAEALLISSSGWAHGVAGPPDVPTVVYCHNPPRWLHQPDIYLTGAAERTAMRLLRPHLLRWDRRAARRAHTYLANSNVVADRIREAYDIDAQVVHPPVTIDAAGEQAPVAGIAPGFFLTVSRARGYKNVARVAEAVASIPGAELVVIGSGTPDEEPAPNVRWLGLVSDAELRWLYAHATALVTVAFEDFGLTPLEANAFGTPVAALRAGGHLDSVVEGVSGSWIEEPTAASVRDTLVSLPSFDRRAVLEHAAGFSLDAFTRRIDDVLRTATGRRVAVASATRRRGEPRPTAAAA